METAACILCGRTSSGRTASTAISAAMTARMPRQGLVELHIVSNEGVGTWEGCTVQCTCRGAMQWSRWRRAGGCTRRARA